MRRDGLKGGWWWLFGWLVAANSLAASLEIVLQRGHDQEVSAAVYSPDQRIIASAGEMEAIRLWDRATGDLVRMLPGHPERIVGLAFSPNGQWLASSSTDGSVKVWDYREGRLIQLFTNHVGNWARRVAFSPDSRLLAAAVYDKTLSVWEVASGAVVRTLPTGGPTVDVVFTPDGRHLATVPRAGDSQVRLWELATGRVALTLSHSNRLNAVAISRDGRRLATGGDNGMATLWALPSGMWLRQILTPEKGPVQDVDLSADGRLLATAGQWTNRIWSVDTGTLLAEMEGHEDGTIQVGFSANGRELVSGSADASVRSWNVGDGSVRRIIPKRLPNQPVASLAFSADGRFEALGTVGGTVQVWDARDASFKFDLRGHEGPVHALGFSADGAWLFSGSADRTMRVWDMSHGTVSAVHPFFNRVDAIGTLAVGGRQGLIISAAGPFANASLDHSIKLWQSHFDRPLRVMNGHAASVRSVAFAPGSDLLASASGDGTVKIWNSRDGRCLHTRTNAVLVEKLLFDANSQWLIAGLADGTVQVLETNALTVARQWTAHSRPVQSLALSGDQRWLATGGADHSVVIWDWRNGTEVRRFTNVTSQFMPLAFHPRQPVLAFAQRDELVIHAQVESGEVIFQRALFPDGEWLAWNPGKAFFMTSARGHEHARLRFSDQLEPVYPLVLYRSELQRATNFLASLSGPAPVVAPKNLELWWHRYPYKQTWLYGTLAGSLCWIGFRLQRGWVAERRRKRQESISRQLLISQEAERKRIAAELHDGLGQNLLIIKNRLYLAQREAAAGQNAAQLEDISQTVSQTLEEVRRISHNLRPYQLDRLGLTKAVQAAVKKVSDSGSLRIEHNIANLDGLFSSENEIHLYRVVQESLNNILKHSKAASARLIVERADGRVQIRIEDDGCGFDYRQRMSDSNHQGSFGLTGIRERARLLGGRFTCDSAPGQGTRLTIDIPISQNANSNHHSSG